MTFNIFCLCISSILKFHAGNVVEFILSLFVWCREQVKLLIQVALQYFHWSECKIYKYIKLAALTTVIQPLQLATCIDN